MQTLPRLTESAFQNGMSKLTVRFDLPKRRGAALMDELYDYLKRRITDQQFLASCETLFAEALRFPRPIDFLENAPDYEPLRPMISAGVPDPKVDAPRILVRRGSLDHRKWIRTLEERRHARQQFVRDAAGYAITHAGFRLPVVEIVG